MPRVLLPYSPERSPAEQLFEHLRAELANRIFAELIELEDAVTQHLQDFWTEPAVLRQLPGYGWWVALLETVHPSLL